MTTEQSDLKSIVDIAIKQFNQSEIYLLDRNLSERCICSKFASYLEKVLIGTKYSSYNVDVEYNRGMYGNDYAKKMLLGKRVIVDLIVHKRGYDYEYGRFDNLICIEMKKRNSKCNLQDDKDRLNNLLNPKYGFNYKIGFMLIVNKNGIIIDEMVCSE